MDKKIINTDIAQLAERFPHMEKVASSILAVGTITTGHGVCNIIQTMCSFIWI